MDMAFPRLDSVTATPLAHARRLEFAAFAATVAAIQSASPTARAEVQANEEYPTADPLVGLFAPQTFDALPARRTCFSPAAAEALVGATGRFPFALETSGKEE